MAIIQTPSISNVVEDQTPQLGGSLSTNGSNINVESGDVLYVHNLGTEGDANYERLEAFWNSNTAEINTAAGGTGTLRTLRMRQSGGSYWTDWEAAGIKFYGASSLNFLVGSATTALYKAFIPNSDGSVSCGVTSRRWSNTYTDTITIGDDVDAVLTADAADTLALRNSTTAQQFNVYNTYTDASNYERLEVKWDTNRATIGPDAAGTGTQRELQLTADAGNPNKTCIRLNGPNSNFVFRSGNSQAYTLSGSFFRPDGLAARTLGESATRWATTYTRGIATDVETFTAASDTLDALNNVCLCDCSSNAITLALPVPVAGLQFHIKKIDSTANTVSIEPDDPGPELIDGAIVQTLSSQYDSITVVSDGSNWFVI